MRIRRSIATLIASIALLAAVPGCGTAWQALQANPIGQAQLIIQQARSIESVATVVFNQIQAALTPEARVEAQRKFAKSVVALNHALSALQSALDAAAKANQDEPDLNQVMFEVGKAAEALQAMIDDLRKPGAAGGGSGTAIPTPEGYDELTAQVSSLKSRTAH